MLLLQEELNRLWHHRTDVTSALADAAAEGDRSENAEYIYRKKELREIDRRIRYLQTRIPSLKVVTAVQDTTRIYFGARVTLLDKRGKQHTYRIVGADELQSANENISVDSPLARELLGKSINDNIQVNVANNKTGYRVFNIEYHVS